MPQSVRKRRPGGDSEPAETISRGRVRARGLEEWEGGVVRGDSLLILIIHRDIISQDPEFQEWTKAQGLIRCQKALNKSKNEKIQHGL